MQAHGEAWQHGVGAKSWENSDRLAVIRECGSQSWAAFLMSFFSPRGLVCKGASLVLSIFPSARPFVRQFFVERCGRPDLLWLRRTRGSIDDDRYRFRVAGR